MFKGLTFFDNFTNAITSSWIDFLIQGVTFLLLGLMVLLFPQLLVAMVAVAFMFIGAAFLVLAFKTRSIRKRYRSWRDPFWEQL